MLQEIPLSEDERAAVDGDVQALNRLLEHLKEVPTPSQYDPEDSQKALQTFIPINDVLPAQRLPSMKSRI
jgi:hypothetical protein